MIPLLGFSPDLEPTTPGVILDCDNLIPYESGMKAAFSPLDAMLDPLADDCKGAAVTRDLSGNSRLFAGTETDIYESSGATWASVSGGHTLGVDDRWRYAIFGSDSLAVSSSVNLLRSSGGAFSAIAGAPKAKTVIVCQGFVMLLATDEATYGNSPDRWWCSGLFDVTNWTPSLASQSATGRLVEGSGPLTAGLRLGDKVIAYKERAVFVGEYVGGDVVWQWSPPIGDVGCVGVEAVVDTPIGHIFAGSDNIYLFDGTRPVPLATGTVRQWYLDNSSSQYRYRTKLLWDRDNNVVEIFFPSIGSTGDCDLSLVYHIGSKKWGKRSQTVQAVLSYSSGGITYDSGSPLITTYDASPTNISYDSPFWLASKSSPAVFDTDRKLYSLTGTPGDWYWTTGDYGDESNDYYCDALKIRWAQKPIGAACLGYTKATSGDSLTTASSATFDGMKFPMRQTNRFHRFTVAGSGSMRVSGIEPKIQEVGGR